MEDTFAKSSNPLKNAIAITLSNNRTYPFTISVRDLAVRCKSTCDTTTERAVVTQLSNMNRVKDLVGTERKGRYITVIEGNRFRNFRNGGPIIGVRDSISVDARQAENIQKVLDRWGIRPTLDR